MSFLDSFLVRATFGAIGVAIAAAPLGCFVVWRRMAYFGDATAHAAILGIALSLAWSISPFVGVLVIAMFVAYGIAALGNSHFATDTVLGVIAHTTLAFGLVIASLLTDVRVDLMSYLLGDILSVNRTDLALIWGGAVVVNLLIWWRWSALLTSTLNPEFALAYGVKPQREQLVLMLVLAIVVAVAIKVVGALLITALLIIPPAAARKLAVSPEQMAFGAAAIGVLAAISGMSISYFADTPTGPTIVCTAAGLFLVAQAVRQRA